MLGVKSLCSQVTTYYSLKVGLLVNDYGQIKPEMFAYRPNVYYFSGSNSGGEWFLELRLTGLA